MNLLMQENIHETKPIIENPVKSPKTNTYVKKIQKMERSYIILKSISIPNVPPTEPIIPIAS